MVAGSSRAYRRTVMPGRMDLHLLRNLWGTYYGFWEAEQSAVRDLQDD